MQRASGFANMQKMPGINWALIGSLSESVSVIAPEPLKEIASDFDKQVPLGTGTDVSEIQQRITAIDGSVFIAFG